MSPVQKSSDTTQRPTCVRPIGSGPERTGGRERPDSDEGVGGQDGGLGRRKTHKTVLSDGRGPDELLYDRRFVALASGSERGSTEIFGPVPEGTIPHEDTTGVPFRTRKGKIISSFQRNFNGGPVDLAGSRRHFTPYTPLHTCG